ncbi:hypothetical protein ABFS82_08G156200 [Erythranthe guttata]
MEIYSVFLQHRFFLSAAVALLLSLACLLTIMPPVISVLYYFWPLFVSTAIALVAIIVIGQISPIPREFSDERQGEALLDYVAGKQESLENY